jgi:hypothetical protein
MKKLLISSVAVLSLFANPTIEDLQNQINTLQKELKQLKSSQERTAVDLQSVKQAHYEDHINFHYDLRTSLDYIHYKMKNGDTYSNNILSNRVILTGLAKVDDHLKATLKLEAYNMFGMNNPAQNDNSNWTANETPDDTNIRVKEAFFNYNFGEDGQYMFSAGRRPAVGGYPANLRNNDNPTSPIAHLVNMEFDGFSLWFKPDAMGSMGEDYGTNIKFCFGRGYSSSVGKFARPASYAKSNLPTNDMGGFLLVPYNDDQYSVWWENIWAWNVQGYQGNNMTNVGDYFGSNIIFKADGVGDEISDFLDDTKAFVSFAYTRTSPDSDKTMLGQSSGKSGYSVWIGADMPANEDGDRFGVNVVSGSKYFRPMTYSEDTLAGSIAAVRGYAFDAYYDKKIHNNLSVNCRLTYLDYNKAGSEAFFGDNGNPDQNNYVDEAMDIRAYIRYNF